MANRGRSPRAEPNIEEFAGAEHDSEGLRRIGNRVLIPDYDITARAGGAEHNDWRARRDARHAYGEIVFHGSGDVREGYQAALNILRAHLRCTGRVVAWKIGDGHYLSP